MHPPADQERRWNLHLPSLFDVGRFALFAGITVFAAWLAGTGRVMYVLIMLVIAAALVYAVVDLADYEIVKRRRRG
jgi:hypothetical protein